MPLTASPARRHRHWRMPTLLFLLLAALAPLAAQAQSCWVPGSFTMNFGTVGSNGGPASSSIQYVCQNSGPTRYFEFCLYMGPGQFSVGQQTRRMYNNNQNNVSAYLNYDLYADPTHNQKIGAVGTTPAYRLDTLVIGNGQQPSNDAYIYGLVHPDQSVPAHTFQEQQINGTINYRFGPSPFTPNTNCTSGGTGGGSISFGSSGVFATFANTCRISATNLDFGQTPPPSSPLSGQSTITVQCPANTAWSIALDDGLNYSGGMRHMTSNGSYVAYHLYTDANHSRVWGTLGATVSGTTDANANAVNVPVYGQVPAQPTAVAGSYSDTIIATLTY